MVYCALVTNSLLATARHELCFTNAQKTIVYPIPNPLLWAIVLWYNNGIIAQSSGS